MNRWLMVTLGALLGAACDARTGFPQTAPVVHEDALEALPWLEVGGSNHVILSAGDYLTNPTDAAWYGPNGIKPVVGSYHALPGVGRAQLHAMRLAGQKKVALVLWSMHFGSGIGADVYGHVVRSDSSRLTPQHEANFRAWLADVEAEGFDEVQLRFACQGPSDPQYWTSWDEGLYQETWNFMVNTRAVMESALSPSTRRVYDLGGEYGGLIEYGQNHAYTRRLWNNWVSNFGVANTVGFSFATYPGRLQKMIAVYDEVGVRPTQWAFDIYDHVDEWMGAVAQEFAAAGISNPSLYVQETFADDEASAIALAQVAANHGLRLRTLMQWPVKPGGRHFTMNFAESYAAYLRPRNTTPVPPPVLSRGGIGCDDNTCLWLVGTDFSPGARVELRDDANTLLQREDAPVRQLLGTETLLTLRVTSAMAAFSTTGVVVTIVNEDGASSGALRFVKPPAAPPPTPAVSNAGTGCEDNFCLWIVGSELATDCVVELRQPGGPVLAVVTQLYRSPTVLTLRLETQALRDALVATGLELRVLNGTQGSNSVTVTRP